jgi:hypothetical protein
MGSTRNSSVALTNMEIVKTINNTEFPAFWASDLPTNWKVSSGKAAAEGAPRM